MNKSAIKGYAKSITTALTSRHEATTIELAVSFAVLLDCDENKRVAKELLCQIYTLSGGYQAATPNDRDWRSVNRHIAAAFALFDFLGGDEVQGWVQGSRGYSTIDLLIENLKPLKLRTVNEVLTVCEKVKRGANREGEAPDRRRIETEHLHIAIPKNVTRAELLECAQQMIKLAEEMLALEAADAANAQADTVLKLAA